jgi:hypothetical protein
MGIGAIIVVLLFFLIPAVIFCLVIASIIFWVFMLVDVVNRKFKQESDKTLWLLVVILTGLIGAIIYYFQIKKSDKH